MKLFLKVLDRLIDTGQTYNSLQDSKADYPWSVFETWVDHGNLITRVRTENVEPRKEMKGRGPSGWCY